jgi:hypothetical protein
MDRRSALISLTGFATAIGFNSPALFANSNLATITIPTDNKAWDSSVGKGLKWLASQQSRSGQWADDNYPTAISALAAIALICSGSTTTQGPYASNIRLAVDFMISKCRKNGLIGDPHRDDRYTYGHEFAMLFLSQVLGEEEDIDRRDELIEVLNRAIRFSADAQTSTGGWGYVSSKQDSFDEGSTTITQVQGLRGCRNAGLVVPTQVIEDAKKYIYKCQNRDGGISYSTSTHGSSRPAITAAALAALYNAGDYGSDAVPKMLAFSQKHLHNLTGDQSGHWHYTYLYYTQVVYRQDQDVWIPFRNKLYNRLVSQQLSEGQWTTAGMGASYVTAVNLIMLQMDNGYLPIYQR